MISQSVYDLTVEEATRLYRTRHMNNYVYAALLTLARSRAPRGRLRLAPGSFAEPFESSVNALLELVPRLGGGDSTGTRVAITLRLTELYSRLPTLGAAEIPAMMRLLASLAFVILEAERADGLPIWFYPPLRSIEPRIRPVYAMMLAPFTYDEVYAAFREEFELREVPEEPMPILFGVTIFLTRVMLILIENGLLPEMAREAFCRLEESMVEFERRHELGNVPAAGPLNVARQGQIRYRNTLYLYGGDLLRRMDLSDEARAWYLKDIDNDELLGTLTFFMTAFKTCERLLCGYGVAPSERLLDLLHRALANSLDATGAYTRQTLETFKSHPEIDLASRDIRVDKRRVFFAGEPCREPLLIALLYQRMVRGIPYAETDYSLLIEAGS